MLNDTASYALLDDRTVVSRTISASPIAGRAGVTQIVAVGKLALALLHDGLNPKRYGEGGSPAVSGVTRISVSVNHVLALTSAGRAPRRELPMDEAAKVPGIANAVAHTLVLPKDGALRAWLIGGRDNRPFPVNTRLPVQVSVK